MNKRENELTSIYTYAGRGFFASFLIGLTGFYIFRGKGTPHFRNVMKHAVLCVGGTFAYGLEAERLASELYYNKLLIQLSDKYNFTPQKVLDLQRNLNQHYIRKDREADIQKSA